MERCIPLKRGPIGVVMAGPISGGAPALAALFGTLAIFDVEALYLAVPLGLVAALPLLRPLRLCDGHLVVRRFVLREFRLPLSEVVAIELGRYGWPGLAGYKGYALAIYTSDGDGRLLMHSLYCGEKRLRDWVAIIRAHDCFVGESLTASGFTKWADKGRFPSM